MLWEMRRDEKVVDLPTHLPHIAVLVRQNDQCRILSLG